MPVPAYSLSSLLGLAPGGEFLFDPGGKVLFDPGGKVLFDPGRLLARVFCLAPER